MGASLTGAAEGCSSFFWIIFFFPPIQFNSLQKLAQAAAAATSSFASAFSAFFLAGAFLGLASFAGFSFSSLALASFTSAALVEEVFETISFTSSSPLPVLAIAIAAQGTPKPAALPKSFLEATKTNGMRFSSHKGGKCITISSGSRSSAMTTSFALPGSIAFVDSLVPFLTFPDWRASSMACKAFACKSEGTVRRWKNVSGLDGVRTQLALYEKYSAQKAARRKAEAELDRVRRQSSIDKITGALNRGAFYENAARHLEIGELKDEVSELPAKDVVLHAVDLDGFKLLNDY